MNLTACCADLEKLIAAPGRKSGLGLMIVTAKWGTRFVVEYRKDWSVTDSCTFWYTTEFYPVDGSFAFDTWLASLKFPNCH
jgi:hypothetical protein